MIMPQCHTQAEVFEQFARVSRLIEGTLLSLSDLVRWDNIAIEEVYSYEQQKASSKYSFALAIVEGKPVFIGDTLWSTRVKHFVTITGMHEPEDISTYGEYFNFAPEGHPGYSKCCNVYVRALTWQEPKRTFTLNGEELPLPDDTHGRSNTVRGTYYLPEHAFTHFRWDSVDARDKVQAAILKLLNGERNER